MKSVNETPPPAPSTVPGSTVGMEDGQEFDEVQLKMVKRREEKQQKVR